ncbi:Zn(II)2Cys6 transcription factor [Aspergillus neoniger CBS 115656]|uniref:Zn(2)-C6 fungal-type domain-containing protein n=1 Tax=Aspergillus neoniger (strain CBS 115656) TaxID=1448310 RepID=A0A318YM70_ASPNB|nr:hypothetical protein BO87DRAFT_424962 [Aspergillus neoniger CBS 115656]PYH35479.1 hypothetical protein BO87DRAFT_424962 [Aspergillus neoniger CBS 115656]
MRKKTCLTCKSRKVRCDGVQPVCGRCSKSSRSCRYAQHRSATIAFRHSKLSTLVAQAEGFTQTDKIDVSVSTQPPASTPVVTETTQVPSTSLFPTESVVSALPANDRTLPHNVIRYPTSESGEAASSPSFPRNPYTVSPTAPIPRPGLLYRHASRRLTTIEGELLHFFVQNIGPWLDVTSPERHYTYTVPRLSLQCTLLHTAIMACSAHILRLLNPERTELSSEEDKYQSTCINLLIPILNDVGSAVQDEAVLATITILRMSEQYDEYHIDRQCHLVPGAFAHLDPSVQASTRTGDLLQATFYSYVRADIRMAILGRCSTKIAVSSWPLDESYPETDADWANRMTWLLVHAINHCFGRECPGLLPRAQLGELIDDWRSNVPDTFEPYYYEEQERDSFPVIRLLCPWHVVGLQFYHTAKILLASHFPQPPSSPHTTPDTNINTNNTLTYHHHLKTTILPHVHALCAISFSNDHFGCRINASHCVAMGEYHTSFPS